MKVFIQNIHQFIYIHLRDWYYKGETDDDQKAKFHTVVLFTVSWVMPVIAIYIVSVDVQEEIRLPFDEYHPVLQKIYLIPLGLLCFGISGLVFRLSGLRNPADEYRLIKLDHYPKRWRLAMITLMIFLWFSPVWLGLIHLWLNT